MSPRILSFQFQSLFALVALNAALSAQTLTIPTGPLSNGETIVITYSNPSMAGKKITVDIDDGAFPTPNNAKIEIQLDANGNGKAAWLVAAWELAKFNAPDVPEQVRVID